ncbi:osteoclast stimulatory transmembrane protein [Ahaetulla prasina]|uniref:osteoclast stimulatory transmembrane protein n=1 Tax=Ahaetulla prasina TaxID=499056 RepID=UPI0026492D6D|nr:osteoclast stimulatory transmembrane protein [Ahaetulla prasina]
MNIFRIADCFQRIWELLHKTGLGIWTYMWDINFLKIQEFMLDIWLAYSIPLPSSHSQLLSLCVICSCIAASVGGLFYCWMFSSLQYSFQFSALASSVLSFLVFLILFLVHPVRCLFTTIVPTLGTRQGRRLLLSACFMIVAVNIIPNIMNNIQAILKIIKCTCKNSMESLVASMLLLGNASWDFSHSLKDIIDNMPYKFLSSRDSHVQFRNHSNIFQVNEKMVNTSQSIKEDFLYADKLVQKVILLTNRASAGFFLFYLLFQATWYLKNYLTNVCFDNIYITPELEDLARENKTADLLFCTSRKLIKPTSFKLSPKELKASLRHIFLLTLVLVVMLLVIATDYIAFHLAQTAVTEITQIPVVPVTFWVKYEIELSFLGFQPSVMVPFERNYHQNLTFVSFNCFMQMPTPPNTALVLAVVLLFCIIYATVFLEAYSHRLRRKISASFFQNQENQRIQYLYKKLIRKHKKKEQLEASVLC